MSKQVILNQATLMFFGEFGLPDKITSDLEERLRHVDWNKLLKPVLRGIPARIDVVDTTGPERAGRQKSQRGKGRKRGTFSGQSTVLAARNNR
jgi:hypothetical protein